MDQVTKKIVINVLRDRTGAYTVGRMLGEEATLASFLLDLEPEEDGSLLVDTEDIVALWDMGYVVMLEGGEDE